MNTKITSVLLTSLFIIPFACSNNSTGPDNQLTPAQVAGEYQSTTFTVQLPNGTFDILSLGGFINMTLTQNQTTTGRLFIPDTLGLGSEDGGDFDMNLQGTYAISGKTITFQQNADTFVRDMTWTYDNGTLSGSDTFSEATITVTLRKK